jgi:hypothetical protein
MDQRIALGPSSLLSSRKVPGFPLSLIARNGDHAPWRDVLFNHWRILSPYSRVSSINDARGDRRLDKHAWVSRTPCIYRRNSGAVGTAAIPGDNSPSHQQSGLAGQKRRSNARSSFRMDRRPTGRLFFDYGALFALRGHFEVRWVPQSALFLRCAPDTVLLMAKHLLYNRDVSRQRIPAASIFLILLLAVTTNFFRGPVSPTGFVSIAYAEFSEKWKASVSRSQESSNFLLLYSL